MRAIRCVAAPDVPSPAAPASTAVARRSADSRPRPGPRASAGLFSSDTADPMSTPRKSLPAKTAKPAAKPRASKTGLTAAPSGEGVSLEPIVAALRARAPKAQQEQAEAFLRAFYRRMSVDEYVQHSPENWAALASEFLGLAHARKPG